MATGAASQAGYPAQRPASGASRGGALSRLEAASTPGSQVQGGSGIRFLAEDATLEAELAALGMRRAPQKPS